MPKVSEARSARLAAEKNEWQGAELTQEEKNLVERLDKHRKDRGISLNQLGKRLGCSKSTIASLLGGKYKHKPGKSNGIYQAARNYLILEEGRASADDVFIETLTSKMILEDIEYAIQACRIVALVGASGIGKSFSIREHIKRNTSSHQYIRVVGNIKTTPKSLFVEIANQMDSLAYGETSKIFNTLVLMFRKNPRVIFIDEANQVGYETLDLVRSLWDQIAQPVILIGTEKLITTLRKRGRPAGDLEQLWRRIDLIRVLPGLQQAELDRIVKSRLGQVDNETLAKIAEKAGKFPNVSIARVNQLLRRSEEIARINKTDVSPAVVEKAASLTVR